MRRIPLFVVAVEVWIWGVAGVGSWGCSSAGDGGSADQDLAVTDTAETDVGALPDVSAEADTSPVEDALDSTPSDGDASPDDTGIADGTASADTTDTDASGADVGTDTVADTVADTDADAAIEDVSPDSLDVVDTATPEDATSTDGSEDGSPPDTEPEDSTVEPSTEVFLNEIACKGSDWVEIVAPATDGPIALEGWSISDNADALDAYVFPPGAALAGGEWLVVAESPSGAQPAEGLPFGIKCGTDTIVLMRPDGSVADSIQLPETPEGATWGRIPDGSPDGSGSWTATLPTPGSQNTPWIDYAAELFNPMQMTEIDIFVPPAGLASLWTAPSTYVDAKLRVAVGDLVTDAIDVQVRIKGQLGSFRNLNSKSAFKVKLNPGKNGNTLFGLERLTLNNMVQDASMLHEVVFYEILRAMGVPAARTGYAWVRVNGRDYGVYLNLETYDDVFCDAHFPSTLHLYEGAYGTDVKPGSAPQFEVDQGDPSDLSDLAALIAAAEHPAGPGWSEALGLVVDLDQMRKVWALEVFSGHWDGYAPTINNYYLHSDEEGRFSMLASGSDQTFASHLGWFAGKGHLFASCVQSSDCRAAYELEQALLAQLVASLDLDPFIVELAAFLHPWIAADPRRPYSTDQVANAVQGTRDFLASRLEEAQEAFGCQLEGEPDPDGDGYTCATDCDNTNESVHPGVEDLCDDDLDNDCDGFTDNGPGCPDWKELYWQGKRYLITNTPRTFAQGRAHCQAAGSEAVVLNSAVEAQWLRTNAPALLSDNFWIGLTDLALEGTFVWVDGTPLGYQNFNGGEPNDWGGNEDCIEWYPNGTWNDINCNDTRRIVCEDLCVSGQDIDGDGFVGCTTDCDDDDDSIYPGATEVCLDGKDQDCNGVVDDGAGCTPGCVGIPGTPFPAALCSSPSAWQAARIACQQLGGELAWFVSQNQQNAFIVALNTLTGGATEVWFGLNDQVTEGDYRWITGAKPTYTTWADGQPNNAGEQDCVRLLASGTWNDTACTLTYPFICRLPPASTPISALPEPPPCTPACAEKACGPDGCGGTCGECADGAWCVGGQCLSWFAIADSPNSCEGHCGGQAPGGCWCDDACTGFGDCCADYAIECQGGGGGCASVCDKMSPLGCYCDDLCPLYHDCCDDYVGQCGGGCTCKDKECGTDGCGHVCGTCPAGEVCDASGACVSASSGEGCQPSSGEPGCDGCACEACVCQTDPYCCYVAWDPSCATHCATTCGAQSQCSAL